MQTRTAPAEVWGQHLDQHLTRPVVQVLCSEFERQAGVTPKYPLASLIVEFGGSCSVTPKSPGDDKEGLGVVKCWSFQLAPASPSHSVLVLSNRRTRIYTDERFIILLNMDNDKLTSISWDLRCDVLRSTLC